MSLLLRIALLVIAVGAVGAQPRAPRCEPSSGRRAEAVAGKVERGALFEQQTSGGWILELAPLDTGWLLQVITRDRPADDLARLTPPLHSTPNPRQIDGWHFRNAGNTAPNDGSVNAPQELREFIFSPRVGRDIQGPGARASVSVADVDAVRAFGQGWLFIESYRLTPPRTGERAAFEWVQFSACLTWPAP